MGLDRVLRQFMSQHKLGTPSPLKKLNSDPGVLYEALHRPGENQSFRTHDFQEGAMRLVPFSLFIEHFDHVFATGTKIDGRPGMTHFRSVKPLSQFLRCCQIVEDQLSGSSNGAAEDERLLFHLSLVFKVRFSERSASANCASASRRSDQNCVSLCTTSSARESGSLRNSK